MVSWVDGGADGVRAVGRRNAGGDALASLDGLSKRRPETRGVLLRHGKEPQVVGALFGEGKADKAAAIAGHKVDGFGRDVLSRQRQVALVFAILVVNDDDHAAGSNFGNGAGHVGKWRFEVARWTGHGGPSLFSPTAATNGKEAFPRLF